MNPPAHRPTRRRLAAIALTAAALTGVPTLPAAASAAPAPAAKKKPKKVPRFVFTFEGRGYGHGIGMSQYGAYGAALAGQSAEEIIARYYPGTALSTLPATPVRVLLAAGAPSLRLSANGPWRVTGDGAPLTPPAPPLPADVEMTVTVSGPGVLVRDAAGGEVFRSSGPVMFAPARADVVLALGRGRYRGSLRIAPEGTRLSAVNHIDLEQYLLGVVPREMPSKWGDGAPEALRAQAIAARTYAMATRKAGAGFDMYADERSQVYGGVAAEDPRTSAAVASTAGRVVTLGGKIVTTFFFSTSGGRTENVENVFGQTPMSYLVSVNDAIFDRLSPHHKWRDPKTFTDARLAKLLGTRRPVLSLKVTERGASPRVKQLRIVTRSGAVKIMTGREVRRALDLRDTWFTPKRRVLTPTTARLVTSTTGG